MSNSKKKRKAEFKESAEKKSGSKGSKALSIGIVAGVIIAATVAFLLIGGPSSGFKVVDAEAGTVRIPVSDVNDGHAHFYTFKGNKAINFFVLRSSDGVIRAAFDACDVCYASKKGYHQEGDTMVCNNCGQRFPSAKINEIKGGCNPAPLNRRVDGNYLLIDTREIEAGAWYF